MLNRPLLPLLLIGLLLSACSEAPAPAAEPPAPITQGDQLRFTPDHPQLKLLKLVEAKAATTLTIEVPAKLVWNEERTQRIYPSFAGRVLKIQADVGQSVKTGAPLAQLASPDFGQAQSETVRAEADARLATRNLQRQRELFEAGIVARKELEQAEAEAERASAEVDRARARTQLYGGGGQVDQQLQLRASLSGVVVERNLNPGQELRTELAGPGVPPLFVVTDPSSLWIQIDMRESEIGVLRPGTSFNISVSALSGRTFKGRVITTTDFIDPLTRTIKVRGLVPNADRQLKAEMLATARFERSFRSGVLVPASAVLLRGARASVFVQTRPGEFERRSVELEHEGPKDIVISRGVTAGEQIVVDNALLLARMVHMAEEESHADGAVTKPAPRGNKP